MVYGYGLIKTIVGIYDDERITGPLEDAVYARADSFWNAHSRMTSDADIRYTTTERTPEDVGNVKNRRWISELVTPRSPCAIIINIINNKRVRLLCEEFHDGEFYNGKSFDDNGTSIRTEIVNNI